jgi:hypothetical protein
MTEPYAGIWLGYANMLHVDKPTAATSLGTTEVELCWSADLIHWQYVQHGTPFIKRGPQGSFDCCEIFGAKQQPVIEGDTMRIFYTGGNGPFMGSRAAGFSVATLQRDWWFGYTPLHGAAVAKVITTEVQVGSAGTLLVSADARKGSVTVGVVSSSVTSKLSAVNCVPLRGNLTEGAVAWKVSPSTAEPPLAEFVGKNVSLEFVLQPGTVLFAFDLPDLKSDIKAQRHLRVASHSIWSSMAPVSLKSEDADAMALPVAVKRSASGWVWPNTANQYLLLPSTMDYWGRAGFLTDLFIAAGHQILPQASLADSRGGWPFALPGDRRRGWCHH